jgi:hypothetical protein
MNKPDPWRRAAALKPKAAAIALWGAVVATFVSLILANPGPGASHAQGATLTLYAGWNLISLPLQPEDPSPQAVLAPITGKYNAVFAYDSSGTGSWLGYDPNIPPALNTLTALEPGAGLWLNMKEAAELAISGDTVSQVNVAISPGWNLVGYPLPEALAVGEALASIEGKYTPSSATTLL